MTPFSKPIRYMLFAACTWLILLPLFMSCGKRTLEPGGVYKGDPVLYQMDNTLLTADELLLRFVDWEHRYHNYLGSKPEITHAANHVRTNYHTWLTSAKNMREVYANTPTSDNRQKALAWITMLQGVINEVLVHMAPMPPAAGPFPYTPETTTNKVN